MVLNSQQSSISSFGCAIILFPFSSAVPMPCASGSTLHCSSPIIFYFCQKLSYLFIYLSLTCLECLAQHKALQSGVRNYHYFVWEIPNFVLLLFHVFCFLVKGFLCVTALATLELRDSPASTPLHLQSAGITGLCHHRLI